MERKIWFAAVAVATLFVVAGIASAYGMGFIGNKTAVMGKSAVTGNGMSGMMGSMMGGSSMMNHHEEMESLMEQGTYSDLEALREKYGSNIMPFVRNEQGFKEMQEHHESMEKFHEQNEFGM